MVVAQPRVGPIHVADDDRDVLEPAVVAARVGGSRTPARREVFCELDRLGAECEAGRADPQSEHALETFVFVSGDLGLRQRDPKARPNGLLEWTNNVTFDYDIGFIMGDSATPASWKANVRNSYFICPPGNIRDYALSRASLDRNGAPNFSLHLDNCRWDRDGDAILDGTNAGYSMATGDYITLASPV